MNRREYNGWSNYETWLVNRWYGDFFIVMFDGEEVTAEYMQDLVEEMLESDGALPQYGFAADIMNAALRKVDWQELAEQLAEHYAVEDEKEDETFLDVNNTGGKW